MARLPLSPHDGGGRGRAAAWMTPSLYPAPLGCHPVFSPGSLPISPPGSPPRPRPPGLGLWYSLSPPGRTVPSEPSFPTTPSACDVPHPSEPCPRATPCGVGLRLAGSAPPMGRQHSASVQRPRHVLRLAEPVWVRVSVRQSGTAAPALAPPGPPGHVQAAESQATARETGSLRHGAGPGAPYLFGVEKSGPGSREGLCLTRPAPRPAAGRAMEPRPPPQPELCPEDIPSCQPWG